LQFSFDAPVPGTILTQADEINAHGQIVGIHTGEDGIWHSFLISGASFTSFDFPGSTGSGAYGINSAAKLLANILLMMDLLTDFWQNPPRRENRSSHPQFELVEESWGPLRVALSASSVIEPHAIR
jgi:hypothetical protein